MLTIDDARAVASNLAQLHELIVDAWHTVVPKKVQRPAPADGTLPGEPSWHCSRNEAAAAAR